MLTPDQLASWSAAATLLNQVGAAPILSLIVIGILAPWVILVFVSLAHYRRFEAVCRMYENNVLLVENCVETSKGFQKLVTWSTAEVSKLNKAIEDNMHCPIVRENAKPKGLQHG